MKKIFKQIVVLGGGESGVGAAILAKKNGYPVFLSDAGTIKAQYEQELLAFQIPYEQQKHSVDKILSADLVIKSPGISPKNEIIQKIQEKEIPIISEIEFAFGFTSAKIIAITGSAGKTTTTSMIYKILKDAGMNVACCGNIGYSMARTLAFAEQNFEYLVVEVSSFQLENVNEFHPHIAVITNISENHLDRYDNDLSKYAQTKIKGLLKNCTSEDYLVYCMDSEILVKELKKFDTHVKKIGYSYEANPESSAYIVTRNSKKIINIRVMSKNKKKIGLGFEIPVEELKVKGKHNEYNASASAIVGDLLGIRNDIIRESLKDFEAIEHRLEVVAVKDHITYVNDSKATSALAVWYALESMTTPVIWIAGGVDKGSDWGMLMNLVSSKVKGIVLLGKTEQHVMNLKNAFENVVEMMKYTNNMQEAVKVARQMASEGDTILLSPGCASFDLFENYEARGKAFKDIVLNS
jgi:UDP-N-acetylmuramoylalanine--D-glutamate ligase